MALPKHLYAAPTPVSRSAPPDTKAAVLVMPRRREAISSERSAEAHIRMKIAQADRVFAKLNERSKRLAAAIKRLQRSKALADKRVDAIEQRAIREMTAAKLNCVHTWARRDNPPALIIFDEALIPAEYVDEQLVSTPNKAMIKAALMRREDVAGARLSVGKRLERVILESDPRKSNHAR